MSYERPPSKPYEVGRLAREKLPEPPSAPVQMTATLVLSFVAAGLLAIAGFQLVSVQTVAEDFRSVDELFANGVGIMSFGLAALALAFGLRR
jgi:hypothetical protein